MAKNQPNGTYRLITDEQLSQILGIPKKTLSRWRYERQGPAYIKVGRAVRYRLDDIESWIETQRQEPSGLELHQKKRGLF